MMYHIQGNPAIPMYTCPVTSLYLEGKIHKIPLKLVTKTYFSTITLRAFKYPLKLLVSEFNITLVADVANYKVLGAYKEKIKKKNKWVHFCHCSTTPVSYPLSLKLFQLSLKFLMAIMGQQIQCCSIMKDITATPFFPRSSLLHKRLGAMKSPNLVKKFHHAGDLNRTPAILVSSAFFSFYVFSFFRQPR